MNQTTSSTLCPPTVIGSSWHLSTVDLHNLRSCGTNSTFLASVSSCHQSISFFDDDNSQNICTQVLNSCYTFLHTRQVQSVMSENQDLMLIFETVDLKLSFIFFAMLGVYAVILSVSQWSYCWAAGTDDKSEVLDIDSPDPNKFPDFHHATRYECVLQPGDVLFIPGRLMFLPSTFLSDYRCSATNVITLSQQYHYNEIFNLNFCSPASTQ